LAKGNFVTALKNMFDNLKEKWGAVGGKVSLILVTFALGGSLTGFLARKVMTFLEIEALYLYIPLYIILLTIFWPAMVLLVSLPLGQFFFFRSYIRRIAKKISRK
jgi:hypothetical protein